MEIYCSKCKRKTLSTNVEQVKTINNKWRLKAKCLVCKHEKSTFTKAPQLLESKPTSTKEQLIQAKEVHSRVIKKFPRRRIVTLGIDDLWAADLVIMDKYASENDGFKYMLNVIDTFSKYVWSEPLTRKTGVQVVKAFKRIVNRARVTGHQAPNLLHTDKGTEFRNKEFKRLLAEYGTKMYHTENEEKSAIIERFNRTLNEKMKMQFEIRQSFRWVDILQGLLKEYNNSYHSTIRMKPIDVNKSNESLVRMAYITIGHRQTRTKFKVGDRVRITIKKDQFANKYRRNWTREIFTIVKVLKTTPTTYRISDLTGEEILGSFYERELQRTAL